MLSSIWHIATPLHMQISLLGLPPLMRLHSSIPPILCWITILLTLYLQQTILVFRVLMTKVSRLTVPWLPPTQHCTRSFLICAYMQTALQKLPTLTSLCSPSWPLPLCWIRILLVHCLQWMTPFPCRLLRMMVNDHEHAAKRHSSCYKLKLWQ